MLFKEEFDVELRRAQKASKALPQQIVSSSITSLESAGRDSASSISRNQAERLDIENKRHQEDLAGLRNGYEAKIRSLEEKYTAEKQNMMKQLDSLNQAMEIDRRKSEELNKQLWKNPDQMPPAMQERFYELLDQFKVQCRNQHNTEKTEMMESFQRERAQIMRNIEEERSSAGKL